ncbi:MAG: DUF1906 domain-containing protein [Acidobacteria bacterium]|nr:DUF1906 domain-containing protein [Acidobacteriota bacterium]
MKRRLLVALSFCCFLPFCVLAQSDDPFRKLMIGGGLQQPARSKAARPSAQIRDVEVFGRSSGVVSTGDAVLRSDDNGRNWQEIAVPRSDSEIVAGIYFRAESGRVVLADQRYPGLKIALTLDGGNSWETNPIELLPEHIAEASLDRVEFVSDSVLRIRLASSSNFVREALYRSDDQGRNWRFVEELMKLNSDLETPAVFNGEAITDESAFGENRWIVTQNGRCEGFKIGCWQETKLFGSENEITPALIKERVRLEKANAKLEVQNSVFAMPPGGNTRISLNRGFDKCTAATSAQMQIWWDNSYFFDANIYMSGRNRGCSQPQLTAAWVTAVAAQGWGLIPTVVGYQSPCSVSTTSVKHSSDPATAETQGRGEADIAVTDAINLGLTAGSILYYDMERYDDVSGTGACSTPTKAFLKGWTDRVKELGFKSGVYGSPTNAVGDWLSIPEASRMDAVWLARWDNVMSVWTYNAPSPVVPESAWGNHQRIKQWQAPHNETWGGVTFNIDGNIADGPVASNAIVKNRRADFDGDGKSDISVWRPSNGVWYVANSAAPTYYIQTFGIPTDVIAPGDYDGDGKTDLAVWRPDTGVWHLYSRTIYTAYQFGAVGDIPVPADYDGDGRTDIAVFRPSTGVWYVKNSLDSRGTSFMIQQFGLTGDKPVPDDFDGDGKADLAVWRPDSGVWHLLRSTDGYTAIQFGLPGDQPVQADFDGDGKSDLGIYRAGVWYLYRTQAGVTSLQFGLSDDVPATGDFDGDGKYDVAVFRPSTGVWYMNRSQAGFAATQFGISGDEPVEAGYTP